jgi:hypothetical protein
MYNISMKFNNIFKKENLLKISISVLVFSILILPVISLAQGGNIDPSLGGKAPGKIHNPLAQTGVNNITDLIKKILEGIIKIGVPIVALAIIYAGFLFVFARGKEEKLTEAKDTLLYTLIGAGVLIGSWAIAQIITNTVTAL